MEKENLDPVPRLDYFQVLDAKMKQFRIQLRNRIRTPATDTCNCIKATWENTGGERGGTGLPTGSDSPASCKARNVRTQSLRYGTY